MINRETYCKDCDRSIYATGVLARSCDTNIEDNGYYNLSGEKCYCKIVNGKRAEKYPWEADHPAERERWWQGMSNTEEIIDCHYCEHACCENSTGWCQCYNDDGYFSHNIKDSEKEAKDCDFFEFCDIFPKT